MASTREWFRLAAEHLDPETERRCNAMAARRALERAEVILSNMAEERTGFWASFFGLRWAINHEPLRGDARSALPQIADAIKRIDEELGQ